MNFASGRKFWSARPITDEKNLNEQSLPKETTVPLLDEKLAISYLGSEAELKEMLGIMLKQSMTETIALIRDAYQKQNMEALKQATHKFKSSCLYCATSQLLHYTQKLENQADHQDSSMLQAAYDAFLLSLEATKDYIEQWLSKR